ncbi:rhombosortase [Pseudoalteromonas sp. CO325X]|uniref:rhombosortase n=1 Tax=Pseudoalteromonas sp. CO325X TaxID=1777262 RepID=UPI001023367F|nr:rhombosortase [Pseudoalteromonas sp. CO325X]RZF80254.1 rhombosortase [Pseudoalteromonas sp. CO325X]
MTVFKTLFSRRAMLSVWPLIALCTLLMVIDAAGALSFQRPAIAEGQWYRLLTGHFLHSNWPHLGMNMAGALVLWSLHGHFFSVRQYWLYLLLLSFGVGLCLYGFSPNISLYVGLSGSLHGLIAYGAVKDIRSGEKTGYLIIVGVIAKVAYEQIVGASSDVEALIDSRVAIEAHLFGLLCGLGLALLEWRGIKKPEA